MLKSNGTLKCVFWGDTEVAATGTVTISNVANLAATTHTINIITTDATSITATAHATTTTDADITNPTFKLDTSSATITARNLATCLNANGKINATIPAGASSTTVQITQVPAQRVTPPLLSLIPEMRG